MAKIKGPPDFEHNQLIVVWDFGFPDKLDRALHPFDGSLVIAGLGIGGGERVDAVFVLPVGQLTGEGGLFHRSPAVADPCIVTARQGPGERLVSQRVVGIPLRERLEFSHGFAKFAPSGPDSAALKIGRAHV